MMDGYDYRDDLDPASMPSGVEHGSPRARRRRNPCLDPASMPSGVEHRDKRDAARAALRASIPLRCLRALSTASISCKLRANTPRSRFDAFGR